MDTLQLAISIVLSVCVLAGISLMSKVKSAPTGNLLSAFAMLAGIVATLYFSGVASVVTIYAAILVGALIGSVMAVKAQMIQMPQLVALFNGLGGGASALVGIMTALGIGLDGGHSEVVMLMMIMKPGYVIFISLTSLLAVAVGMIP